MNEKGTVTLITGGTRSGKSSYGEKLLGGKDDVLYIATLKVFDDEMKERVELHKKTRSNNWRTFEGHNNLVMEISNSREKYIMLECIGTMVTNMIFDRYSCVDNISRDEVATLEGEILREILGFVNTCKEKKKEVIIITNEVGLGLVSEYKLGRIFTDIVGRVNQRLGQISDNVYFVCCGIPMRIK
ncbi:MAG: bifunctional adenosylcobinamide kinase/adenosylcobinamide-phosphate guanylyltransferase [Clostridium sp.]